MATRKRKLKLPEAPTSGTTQSSPAPRRKRSGSILGRFRVSQPVTLPALDDSYLSLLTKQYPGKQESDQVLFLLGLVMKNRFRVYNFFPRWKIDFLIVDHSGYESFLRVTADLVDRLMKLWVHRDQFEARHHYTYAMLSWVGLAAFRDPVVVEALSDLETVAYNEHSGMKTRLAAQATLRQLLQLPLPTLKGRKFQPAAEMLIGQHEQIIKALDGFPVRQARNPAHVDLALKKRFQGLDASDRKRIASEGLDERGRYSKVKIAGLILADTYHKAPGTIRHWLLEALQQRKLFRRLLKEHVKSFSTPPRS